jgi:hypothetical protein
MDKDSEMIRVFHFCSYFFILNEKHVPPVIKRICFHQCWIPFEDQFLTNENQEDILQQMIYESNSKLSVLLKELKIQKWYPFMGLVTEINFLSKKFDLYYYHDDTLSVSLINQSKYLKDYNLSLDNSSIYSK